jgi:predicted transcriptional regulator YheO
MHPLTCYQPVADAVAQLLAPHAEVVIHDIESDTVHYIANAFSKRLAGEPSRLRLSSRDLDQAGPVIGPYEKTGEGGQSIRSVTAVLQDAVGVPRGLMCINLDFSQAAAALDLLEKLIRPPQPQAHPELLFRNEWQNQIKGEIQAFLTRHHLDLQTVTATPKIRQQLLAHLETKGLFYARKSIEQTAAILGVSRATAYNDLQIIRKNQPIRRHP